MDIFPYQRAADLRGTYRLRNKTDEPIEVVHVSVNRQVEITQMGLAGATLETEDSDLGFYTYRLAKTLEPGEEVDMTFDLALRNPGFRNNGSNTRLVDPEVSA